MPIYVPTKGASDWQRLLAEPDLHWRDGYSAKSLAECWEQSAGIPPEVRALLETIGPDPALLFALPEHKVPLPGSSRGASQNDLFAFVRAGPNTVSVMIEGKVDEPFDRPLHKWLENASPGKLVRLKYLADILGLDPAAIPGYIPYQLLHRTASALIEAERFKTDAAAMIVHSFSPTRKWFDAFAAFASILGIKAETDCLSRAKVATNRPLFIGWASADCMRRKPE